MSNEVIVQQPNGSAMMLHKDTFDQAYRAAKLFAASELVPKHFQGREPDCFIGLMVANRMGEDPLTVLQNMYVVHGRPGWSTQYMIARANASGVFSGRISWEISGKGDKLTAIAKATLADTGEEVRSPEINWAMAQAEGWTKNAKYKSMPELMFRYRSAAFLIRLYAPEVMLGYQTLEEVETMPPMKNVTPQQESSVLDNINAQIEAEKGTEPDHDPETGEVKEEPAAPAASGNAPKKLNVPLDAQGKPMWTPFVNNVLAAIAGINDTATLAEYQMLYSDDMQRMEKDTPTFHEKLMKGFTSRFQELQEEAEEEVE
nr:hypothetical protein 39 [bacterium]